MITLKAKNEQMVIYGAGLAGLLAGNILRSFKPIIREAQSALPNNHSALRFRTEKVGTACAIPFKKVRVQKAIKYGDKTITEPSLFLSNMYSQKAIGSILSRSINNLAPVERFIAPHDLISQMARNCNIEYSSQLTAESLNQSPIISTIPMPTLMEIMGWGDVPDWRCRKIWTQTARIQAPKCDVYQTIYYPDKALSFYRISLVGNTVMSEHIREPESSIGPHIMTALMDDFGIQPEQLVDMNQSVQQYGTIEPIDEELRKEFIFEMVIKHNIYSAGRIATWRQLPLDDVVEELRRIEKFIRTEKFIG